MKREWMVAIAAYGLAVWLSACVSVLGGSGCGIGTDLDSGTSIGCDGGEVTAPDGRLESTNDAGFCIGKGGAHEECCPVDAGPPYCESPLTCQYRPDDSGLPYYRCEWQQPCGVAPYPCCESDAGERSCTTPDVCGFDGKTWRCIAPPFGAPASGIGTSPSEPEAPEGVALRLPAMLCMAHEPEHHE